MASLCAVGPRLVRDRRRERDAKKPCIYLVEYCIVTARGGALCCCAAGTYEQGDVPFLLELSFVLVRFGAKFIISHALFVGFLLVFRDYCGLCGTLQLTRVEFAKVHGRLCPLCLIAKA